MADVFLISDSHFGHANILNFYNHQGVQLRPFFNMEDMHHCMISLWNQVVQPRDIVYHLGDFAMKMEWVAVAKKLHGTKHLILGNHDRYQPKVYHDAGFAKLLSIKVFKNLVFTHVPIHPTALRSGWKLNVHGHLHNNRSSTPFTPDLGPHYFNVSAEVLDYRPISVDTILSKL